MRDLLEGLSKKMDLDEGQKPTAELMKEVRAISTQLVEIALKRE
jgi:hypothetical protein